MENFFGYEKSTKATRLSNDFYYFLNDLDCLEQLSTATNRTGTDSEKVNQMIKRIKSEYPTASYTRAEKWLRVAKDGCTKALIATLHILNDSNESLGCIDVSFVA